MNCGKEKGRKEGRKGRKKGKRVGNGRRQPADSAGSRVLEREEENLEKSCPRVKLESRDNPR